MTEHKHRYLLQYCKTTHSRLGTHSKVLELKTFIIKTEE